MLEYPARARIDRIERTIAPDGLRPGQNRPDLIVENPPDPALARHRKCMDALKTAIPRYDQPSLFLAFGRDLEQLGDRKVLAVAALRQKYRRRQPLVTRILAVGRPVDLVVQLLQGAPGDA